jgi:hypothetical protein
MLPEEWDGDYLGIDICLEFLDEARMRYPRKEFLLHNIIGSSLNRQFDVAVLISFRGMIINNLGQDMWERARSNISAITSRVLYLEYDGSGVLEEQPCDPSGKPVSA